MNRISRIVTLLSILVAGTALQSCNDNEPFDLGPLVISKLTNKTDGSVRSYHYRDARLYLYKFTTTQPNQPSHASKFSYTDGLLSSIISDSTEVSYLLTNITTVGGKILRDTTTSISGTLATGIGSRTYEYDSGGQRTAIVSKQYTPQPATHRFEYVWSEGNITLVKQFLLTSGAWTSQFTLTMEYDNKRNAFGEDVAFGFTIPELEHFWLSANNPVRVASSIAGPVALTYRYNRFNLPSKYTASSGVEYSFTYTEK